MKHAMLIISILLLAIFFRIDTLFAKQNNNTFKVGIYSPLKSKYIIVFSNNKNKNFCLLEFQNKKIEIFTVKNNKKYVKIYFKNNKAISGEMGLVGISDFYSTTKFTKSNKIVMDAYTAKLKFLVKKYKILDIIKAFKKNERDKKMENIQKKLTTALNLLKEI